MNKKYFASRMYRRISPAMLAIAPLLFVAATVFATPDSLAIRVDSAFRLLNAGNTDSAAALAQSISPTLLPPSQQSHASRLLLAGLQAQPGSRAWLRWVTKFDPKAWSPEEKIRIAREALDAGLIGTAASLSNPSAPQNATLHHPWEILRMRLEASAGDWKKAEARLDAWESDPQRKEGSGEILFWKGWVALHQHKREKADTLFTLASAYADDAAAQRALEYRYAVLLDSGDALHAYVSGLPESPLPDSVRKSSLERVPVSSALHPYALWEEALMSERSGDREGEFICLQELARDQSTLPGRRAITKLTYLKFDPGHPDSAMAAYEHLLLQYQQGVPPEFARSRIQALRTGKPTKSPTP